MYVFVQQNFTTPGLIKEAYFKPRLDEAEISRKKFELRRVEFAYQVEQNWSERGDFNSDDKEELFTRKVT